MTAVGLGHDEVWALLPWSANGTLEGAEEAAVASHLLTCAACREEIERCRELSAALRTGAEAEWTPSPERVRRLMARIDLIEGAGGGGAGWRARLAERVGRLRERLGETTPAVRWALAGQAALVLLLGALAVWQAVAPSQPYRTLAGVGEQLSGRHAQIRVVLADDVTEREVRALLERIQGHIVDGPSGVGAYTVEVPAPASAPDRLASVLETLRSHAGVRLAEPIRTR